MASYAKTREATQADIDFMKQLQEGLLDQTIMLESILQKTKQPSKNDRKPIKPTVLESVESKAPFLSSTQFDCVQQQPQHLLDTSFASSSHNQTSDQEMIMLGKMNDKLRRFKITLFRNN